MAVTKGHGNPRWTKDETVLAISLYLDCAGQLPGPKDPRVIALSDTLRRIPYHAREARKPTFRNPDGVAFKLQNIRQVATGKGLANVSRMDRETWAELGAYPTEVAELASRIRRAIPSDDGTDTDGAVEEPEFAEGRLLTRLHFIRERNPRIRSALIANRDNQGVLTCEICDRSYNKVPDEVRDALFEAHHILPLAAGEQRSTRLTDMALLCACCHRLIHRLIADERRWVQVQEVRDLLRGG